MNKRKYLNIIFIFLFQLLSIMAVGQMMGPEDPGGEPELGDPPLGGGAPLDGGAVFMVIMAAAYGGKKLYHIQKKDFEA